jgi:hypothetical protein
MAHADIFYTSSNYDTGSAGVIVKAGGSFSVDRDAASNFGQDAWGFTFRDHNGAERAMIREYQYGPNDTVYVWDPADFKTPVFNAKTWGSNIHSVASDGQYLYLATYESYAGASGPEDTGEVVRVDMDGGAYRRDRAYHYERHAENGHTVSPHAEDIHIEGGKIYALYGMPYNGVTQYEPTEIVVFDKELNVRDKIQLKDASGNSARNAVTMAEYGGKLYVAAMGGYQGPDSWGDLWEVDIDSLTARQVLDGRDIPYKVGGQDVNVGLYGVDFANDGTAFILAGSYSGSYSFRARLFITTAERLSKGDVGPAVAEYTSNPGESWNVLWDEKDATLWLMAGTALEARDKSGELLRNFTPAELGDNIYSIALLDDASAGDTTQGDGESGGSGGGGCAGGAFGIASILGVAYMMLKRKKALLIALVSTLLVLSGLSAEGAQVKFLVTPGAGVRAFTKENAHFVPFTEHPLAKGANEGKYEAYTGEIPGENFHYVAGGGDTGFLKTAEVIYLGANETSKTVTVDVEKLNPSRRDDNGFMAADVYLNVNDAQHLVLNAGETFNLIPTRVWQAMQGVVSNYFIEPDYKVEVLAGSGVVKSEWGGKSGLEYAGVTGLKPGVAVLRVTYGPLFFNFGNGNGTYFNPIDSANTGIVIVTVLEAGKSQSSGITTNIAAREYDTIYFDKAKTDRAEYTFKPTANGNMTVRAHRPLHEGGALWGAGWGEGVKNSDGSFTVKLYEGRNIIEVNSDGAAFSEYHVINAKGIGVNLKNLTKQGGALSPGDKLEISFDGIKTPLEKIAGIYNPGYPATCYVKYDSPQGEIRSEGVQYNLSEANKVTVTVPASGKVELTNGVIECGHLGDPLGSHRTRIGNEPVYQNLNAKSYPGGLYSTLPDITLSGQQDEGGNSGGGGGCDSGALAVAGVAALLAVLIKTQKGRRRF